MKAAVYLAIFLHFVRKILAKVSVRPSVPDTFLRFSPGEPVGLDIVVEDSISIAIYNRVIQFPPETSDCIYFYLCHIFYLFSVGYNVTLHLLLPTKVIFCLMCVNSMIRDE